MAFSFSNASKPPATGGLFGSTLGTSQAGGTTGGGGLFGSSLLGQQQQQPAAGATGGLFGQSSQGQQPATGGLFGASSQGQQQQQQQPAAAGTGLFGRVQPTQPAAGGLFGQTSQAANQTQNQTAGGGLFGGSSLFGGGQSVQQQQQQTQTQTQPQASQFAPGNSLAASQNQNQNQQNGTSTYFTTILDKSRKRALGGEADEDLPQLQLGLGDLRQKIKRFAPATPDKLADGRAHYLLAASGVDPGAALRDLNVFNAGAARLERKQTQVASDTDIEGYISNLQTQTTLNMINDGLARSIRDFDTFLEDNVTMEWEAQRKRIYHHFGIKPRESAGTGNSGSFAASESQMGFGKSRRSKAAAMASTRQQSGTANASTFGRSGLEKSVIGAAAPVGTSFQPLFSDIEKRIEADGIHVPDPNDRFQRERQGRFAEKVQTLNEARLRKRCYPILHRLGDAVKEAGEEQSSFIVKAYRAAIEMTGEFTETVAVSDPVAVKERKFAEAYLDENPKSSNSIAIKKRILNGSARFLEKLFFEELDIYIKKSPKEANLGGVPNVINKVKAYVRLRASRKDLAPDNTDLQMLNDDYVWALVFYLLRSGHVDEAVEYVNANAVAFRAIDRNFSAYISDYNNSPEKRLRRDLQERINSEFNQRLRVAPENSIDPYRMACYKVIGRCELRTRAIEDNLHQSIEDYMWIQFILAREVSNTEQLATEVCDLASVQTGIKEVGARHFAKGENYGTYFYLLVLAGLFEEAVEFLYPFAYPDAVHFAIALDYYGLLRVADPTAIGESSLLSYTTRGLPQLKFGHMVGHYTRDFRAANVAAAVDYLTFICLNRDLPGDLGKKQVQLCHSAIRELVLESREFALLLGDMQGDGQRVKGLIEDRLQLIALDDTEDFMRTISIQAASIADDNGRVTDAVLLYHLAGEYDNVAVIITRAMSEALAVQIGQEPLRLQPLKPRARTNNPQAPATSLSLASVDSPFELGKIMKELYEKQAMYKSKVNSLNWEACVILLQVSEVRSLVEQGNWSRALDLIQPLELLPIRVHSDAVEIRKLAAKFSSLLQPVANVVPNLLMWAIVCTTRSLSHLLGGGFVVNEGTKQTMIIELRQQTMDLTTYTGLLRYRFPAYLHEALARAQSE